MKRRDFLKTAAGTIATYSLLSPLMNLPARAAGILQPLASQTASKPNILLILADDLGYGETGCQGGKDIPTPNIDSIAAGGVRFTDAYVSCPVCSPTRAGIMTGRYQQRFGHELNPGTGGGGDNFGLPTSETTFANHFKNIGYDTGIVGKWHLGSNPGMTPTQRGFDEFFGFLSGAHPYLNRGKKESGNPIYRGTEPVQENEYLTSAFAREASSFIDRRKDRPFFLYLPFNAVHAPLQAPPDLLQKFKNIQDPSRRTFAAMLHSLDTAIGKTLAKLREHNLEENTLVIFLSDNGGPTLSTTSGNGPLNGYKAQVLEGGIRVPFMMQWKNTLPAGTLYNKPAISLDILPTALHAAGQTASLPPNLDGVSLLPYLRGEKTAAPHDALFWRYGSQYAARQNDWKLTASQPGAPPKLFNLANDIGETNNLAAQYPAKLKDLQAVYDSWNSGNIDPLWGGGNPGTGKQRKKRKRKQKMN